MSRPLSVIALLTLGACGFGQSRPHNFDLLDVRWSVRLDDKTVSFDGDVTNTLRPDRGAKSIDLDFGSLQIDTITVNGAKTRYTKKGQALTIYLPASPDGTSAVAVRILYHGVPQAGMYFVPAERAYPAHTPVVYTQGEMVDNRFWLPTYDYPDDKATSEGTIDVPDGWFALSNGKLLEKRSQGGRTTYHWKMDLPHETYLISFVAGPYEEGKGSWDGIPVSLFVPNGLIQEGEAAFGMTPDIVKFYSKLTGFKYPWVKYSQSAVPDFMFGGMENVTCTTQTITALHPKSIEPLEDSTGLVAHELAHQWFGDTVTCNGWSDAWINEGWASFLPSFYNREIKGQDAFDAERFDIFEGGLAAHRNRPDRPVVWKGYKDALDMFDNFIYPGGAARMFMLMHQVGEPKFWAATKAYLEERKFTSFDTKAFFDTYSRNLGQDLNSFMNQWFFTSGSPNLTVSINGDNLVIAQSKPTFDLDLPVWVRKGGVWLKKKVFVSGERTTLDLGHASGAPVLVDPECWLMANISNKIPLSADERTDLFLNAPNVGEQLRILNTMLGELSPSQNLEIAAKIKSSIVLRRFLSRLGEGAKPFLLGLTENADRSVADSAVVRLGQLPRSAEVEERLTSLADHDTNDLLRQHALSALLGLTNDPKLADRAWATEGFKDGYRQIALNWWIGHDANLAREKCLETITKGLPEPTRVTAIRLLGSLRDKPGDRRVYEALASVVKEQSFGARNTAISALGTYGDPSAIPLIEPFANAELVFFRHTAQGVLETLRAKK